MLRDALASADLTCLTETENIPPGMLIHPPIDHVCAAPPHGRTIRARVVGWEKTDPSGAVLSDHSGVLAEISSER